MISGSVRSKLAPGVVGKGTDGRGNRGVSRPHVDVEILIPVHNSERSLRISLMALAQYLARQSYTSRIIVVDNGSVDRTTDAVLSIASHAAVDIRLMSCSRRGKGAAVRRGMLGTQATFVGYIDADMATPIATLEPAMELLRGGADVVIASRRCPGAQYVRRRPLIRRIGGRGFRLVSSRWVSHVADTQCGFKFFRGSSARHLFERSEMTGCTFDLELVAMAQMIGYRIEEIPVQWTDGDGAGALWREGYETARQLWILGRVLRAQRSSLHPVSDRAQ